MDKILDQISDNLELIKKLSNDDEKTEFWLARDLMIVLGYIKWQKFIEVIEKAKSACENSNYKTENHFLPAPVKSYGGRPKEDVFLTRYACYLIAQNSDSRKPQVALAQTYFASQTRKQELLEQREYEDKRLDVREKLKKTESRIESTIYSHGIKLRVEFATFKDKHIRALYGGISTARLKELRSIPRNRTLADFDTHVELKAKDFALAMTDFNINNKNIFGKENINKEVIINSAATRKTLISRGIYPESLRSEEDLKVIKSRRNKETKKILNK